MRNRERLLVIMFNSLRRQPRWRLCPVHAARLDGRLSCLAGSRRAAGDAHHRVLDAISFSDVRLPRGFALGRSDRRGGVLPRSSSTSP